MNPYHTPTVSGAKRQTPQNSVYVLIILGVKYFTKHDIQYLISALQQNYKISTDFEGKNYCGLTLEWFYYEGLSMFQYLDT